MTDSNLERHDDRWTKYRPCPLPARGAVSAQPRTHARAAWHVHQHVAVSAGRRCVRSLVRHSQPGSGRPRHGYRDLDTRAGTIDIAIPQVWEGTFFSVWLLTRHCRAEAALTTVVVTCYLLGVSARRMAPPNTSCREVPQLVRTLGVTGLFRSQVSVMAKDLDEAITALLHPAVGRGPVHVRGRGHSSQGVLQPQLRCPEPQHRSLPRLLDLAARLYRSEPSTSPT